MSLIMIAAVSQNGIIGNSKLDKMPWYCKEELQHFKQETIGGTIIMGRTTAEQVGVLSGRDCIVLSRNQDYMLDGFRTITTELLLNEVDLNPDNRYYIAGGAQIYKELIPYITESIISYMNFEVDGDIFLPEHRINKYWRVKETLHDPQFTIIRRNPLGY